MGTMGLIWAVLILAVVATVWLIARTDGGSLGRIRRRETPEETLEQSYARGEIDRDEYESRLADLRR